jgi:hypothetical protein
VVSLYSGIYGSRDEVAYSEDIYINTNGIVRNMVLYGADKAVILIIVYSKLYKIIILYYNTIIIPSISLLPHLDSDRHELLHGGCRGNRGILSEIPRFQGESIPKGGFTA